MSPELIDINEFAVIGVRAVLPAGAPPDREIWRRAFLPRRHEIDRFDTRYYIVMDVLPPTEGNARYECITGAAVHSLENVPAGMTGWVVPAGTYAAAPAAGMAALAAVCSGIARKWLSGTGHVQAAGPLFAWTDGCDPDDPDAVWQMHVPAETPESLAAMRRRLE